MKKILAILMSAVLLLGILAGCSNDAPTATQSSTENEIANPLSAGLLVLNVNAALNITYDNDGLVMGVEGIDENGSVLASDYTDFLGKSCSDAVCDLIAASSHSGFLNAEENYIVIKQAIGSSLPGATFLETIQKDAEAAVAAANSTAVVVLLTEENLDENGYIDLASAKQLLQAAMSLSSIDTLDGTPSPINGLYNFRITAGDYEDDLIVDAVSGDVYQGLLDDMHFEEENLDDEVDTVDPTDEYMPETTPPATQPVEEPVEDSIVDPTEAPQPDPEV